MEVIQEVLGVVVYTKKQYSQKELQLAIFGVVVVVAGPAWGRTVSCPLHGWRSLWSTLLKREEIGSE